MLTEILAHFDMLLFLRRKEIENVHVLLVIKTRFIQVLMIIKRRNLDYPLTRVIARTCCMHITMQHFVHALQVGEVSKVF